MFAEEKTKGVGKGEKLFGGGKYFSRTRKTEKERRKIFGMEYIFLCRTISDNLSTENFKSMTIWTLNICSLSSSIILEFLEEIVLCNDRHRNAARGIWNVEHDALRWCYRSAQRLSTSKYRKCCDQSDNVHSI